VLIAQRPVLTEEVVSENRSRFIIEPLEPGFGYTLGNSLRRTLLSSIPGAAVTSIRVAGALHEFTTLEGVKEDLTDIVLNIKNLVLSSIMMSRPLLTSVRTAPEQSQVPMLQYLQELKFIIQIFTLQRSTAKQTLRLN